MGVFPKTDIRHIVDEDTLKVCERAVQSGRKDGGVVKSMTLNVKSMTLNVKSMTLNVKSLSLI